MVENEANSEYQIDMRIDDESGISTAKVIHYEDEYMRKTLVNADEIVIKDEKISIIFTYPLSVRVVLQFENKRGFTRMDLLRCIYEGYKKIYDEEEKEVGDPGTYNMLYNRRESKGPYGIWGHYLGDLYLDIVEYNPNKKMVNLHIGS